MDRLEAIDRLKMLKFCNIKEIDIAAINQAIQDMQVIADGRMVEVLKVEEGYNPRTIDSCAIIRNAYADGIEAPKVLSDGTCEGYANSGGEPFEYCRACQFRCWKEDDEESAQNALKGEAGEG